MPAMQDRRRHPRVRLDGRTMGRATVFTEFRVVALSENGAAIHTDMPLAMDSRCDLSLGLSHVSVDLKGRVVHVKPPPSEGEPYEIGVEFIEVDDLDRALLQSFLDRERQRTTSH